MKLYLIEPRSPNYNIYSHLQLPRLGMPILGAMARNKGHDVSIFVEDIAGIARGTPDAVMISTTTSTAPRAYELAYHYRKQGIPVAIGGPHVSFQVDEALENADVVVIGEGENSLDEVLARLESHEPGVIQGTQADLASIPIPDFSLVRGYNRRLLQKTTPIQTSRGCPHDCDICSVVAMFGRNMRYEPVEMTLEKLYADGVSSVFFYDDNLAGRPKQLETLLSEMVRRNHDEGRKIGWGAQVRVDLSYPNDEERRCQLMRLMREAGCKRLYVGFEATDDQTLAEMNKHQTVQDSRWFIEACHEQGILVHGMFVCGFDGDTEERLSDMYDFAVETGIDTVQFLTLVPLPGTRTYEHLRSRILTKEWNKYDGHHAVFNPDRMTAQQLEDGVIGIHAKFYSTGQGIRLWREGAALWCSGRKDDAKAKFVNGFLRLIGAAIVRKWRKNRAR